MMSTQDDEPFRIQHSSSSRFINFAITKIYLPPLLVVPEAFLYSSGTGAACIIRAHRPTGWEERASHPSIQKRDEEFIWHHGQRVLLVHLMELSAASSYLCCCCSSSS